MQKYSKLFATLVPLVLGSFFLEPVDAQEMVTRPVTEERNTDDNDNRDDENERRGGARQLAPRVNADGTSLPGAAPQTFGLIAATAESEALVIEGYEIGTVGAPALPDVQGTRINSGKKTSFVRPEEFPTIVNNNYRQVFATTPGLLISEEPSSPIINIGYRGLDTQRSELSQILKDGISIKNEQFGFPESHYTPPLDSLERIEFIRGGAALQFGPQPGGAINFVTRLPRTDAPFHFTTRNVYGSDDLFTSYSAVDGTSGNFGYYAYFNHREREGFRDANGDYDLNEGSAKLLYDITSDSRVILNFDAYDETHGEPGGLTEVAGPGAILYQVNRNASTRLFDRFRLQRYAGSLSYEKDFSAETALSFKAFGGYLSRFSKRQRGGGFGTLPTGPDAATNSIQEREDYTEGAELRLRHDYAFLGGTSTLAGGVYFYHAEQVRTDERGATPDADSGALRNKNTGETFDGAVFAENRFQFGPFSITPGVRIEHLQQSLDEQVNVSKAGIGQALDSRSDFSFVPLFGGGLSYIAIPAEQEGAATEVTAGKDGKSVTRTTATASVATGAPRLEFYGNVSQAYRPRTYGELVPTGANGIVNGDLEEGKSIQYELGVRGKPLPYLNFDVSGFYYTLDDLVGDISLPGGFSSTGNVGDARFGGVEAGFELDVLAFARGGQPSPFGALSLYGNVTLLDAKFTAGPNDGFTPTYAPDYQVKTGLLYRYQEALKVGFIGTMVDDSFADSNNTRERFIPAYTTWDLTAEYKFNRGRFGVIAGINNLFDKDYYGEIRDEGIVPAAGRNYYVGFSLDF